MSEDSPSLKAFILGDPPNAALSQCVASVTAALGTSLFDVRHFDWSSLAGDISEKLEQMFDIRVTDILAAAWKDYQALIDCADPAKHSADETISLPMADHHVETSLKPCLEIVVGERPPVRITFEITCDLELKGLVVKVQDASIRALRIGACRQRQRQMRRHVADPPGNQGPRPARPHHSVAGHPDQTSVSGCCRQERRSLAPRRSS